MIIDQPTAREIADWLGLTPQALGQHFRAGALTKGASLKEIVQQYCAHLRKSAAGRAADAHGVGIARARALNASARGREMENRVRAGELLVAADVAIAYGNIFVALKEAQLSIPDRICDKLAATSDANECRVVVRDAIVAAMRASSSDEKGNGHAHAIPPAAPLPN